MGGFQSLPAVYAGDRVVALVDGLAFRWAEVGTGNPLLSGSSYAATGYITYDPRQVKGGKVGCSVLNPAGRLDYSTSYGDLGTVTCTESATDGRIRIDAQLTKPTNPAFLQQYLAFPLYLSFVPAVGAQDLTFTFPFGDGLVVENTLGKESFDSSIYSNPSRPITNKLCNAANGTAVKGFQLSDTVCAYATAKTKRGGGLFPAVGRSVLPLPGKTVRSPAQPTLDGLPPVPFTARTVQVMAKESFPVNGGFAIQPASYYEGLGLTAPSRFEYRVVGGGQHNSVVAGKLSCAAQLETPNDPRIRCDVDGKAGTATVTIDRDAMSAYMYVGVLLGLKTKRGGNVTVERSDYTVDTSGSTPVLVEEWSRATYEVAPPRKVCDRTCRARAGQSDARCLCCTATNPKTGRLVYESCGSV